MIIRLSLRLCVIENLEATPLSSKSRFDYALLLHHLHFGCHRVDVLPLFPLPRLERVFLEQQFLQLVRRIKIRPFRLKSYQRRSTSDTEQSHLAQKAAPPLCYTAPPNRCYETKDGI